MAPYPDSPPWFCPLKILDYRAQGTPVASDIGDVAALVENAGSVVAPGDDSTMIDAVKWWLSRSVEPRYRWRTVEERFLAHCIGSPSSAVAGYLFVMNRSESTVLGNSDDGWSEPEAETVTFGPPSVSFGYAASVWAVLLAQRVEELCGRCGGGPLRIFARPMSRGLWFMSCIPGRSLIGWYSIKS